MAVSEQTTQSIFSTTMNAQSLQALVIDRHLGELSPEACELLAHHLEQHPAARAEAEQTLQALALTEQVVRQHAELAPAGPLREPSSVEVPVSRVPARRLTASLLAKAAGLVLLAGICGSAGFFAGRVRPEAPGSGAAASSPVVVASTTTSQPRADRPWASYKLTQAPDGSGMRIVRTDTLAMKREALR